MAREINECHVSAVCLTLELAQRLQELLDAEISLGLDGLELGGFQRRRDKLRVVDGVLQPAFGFVVVVADHQRDAPALLRQRGNGGRNNEQNGNQKSAHAIMPALRMTPV